MVIMIIYINTIIVMIISIITICIMNMLIIPTSILRIIHLKDWYLFKLMLHVAHRGYSLEYIDNNIEAISDHYYQCNSTTPNTTNNTNNDRFFIHLLLCIVYSSEYCYCHIIIVCVYTYIYIYTQ